MTCAVKLLVGHYQSDTNAKTIREAARIFANLANREEDQQIIRDMEGNGVVEIWKSPWTSPVVLVERRGWYR